ncbi:MAG: hypothetical protein PHV78_02620 [Patescibacteria group bacterium]|nr:hypothetical protein [Patescibacteria group bacterium]MDD5121716.1 hypothetical protein [Patescibacteria group bacterium]MDD5221711.1 hypothetical protein [Patescibacteria group bacterium]MDD5396120.1 hypothetical protein [Patescibacteria group bacterium]
MLSKKSIEEYKRIYKEHYGQEISDQEALEQGTNLLNFYKILYECELKEFRWKEKLKDSPKGVHIDAGEYTCCVCKNHVDGTVCWYDQNGIKCPLCQKAVENNIIPVEVCKDRDSWYAVWEFDHYFKMKAATVRKFIRNGKLKARIITDENGHTHCEVLMIKENSEVLPSKPKSHMVQNKDGSFHVEYEEVNLDKLLK